MKRILSFALFSALALSLFGTFTITVAADHQMTVPSGYTGIYTATDLRNIDHDLNGNYILMNDIDLSSHSNWVPIGDENNLFQGIFDGNNYTIKNMSIIIETSNSSRYIGLFSRLSRASVLNLTISHSNISVTSDNNQRRDVGSIAGNACGTREDKSIIKGCSFINSSMNVGSSGSGTSHIGGILGSVADGIAMPYVEILNCYNNSSIHVETRAANSWTYSGNDAAGGIVGFSHAFVYACKNEGQIYAKSRTGFTVGGIAGSTGSALNSLAGIEQCYNTGAITAVSYYDGSTYGYNAYCHAGGVVGNPGGDIIDCYNIGTITASATAAYTSAAVYIGGIAGETSNAEFRNCYNLGELKTELYSKSKSTNAYVGGILGRDINKYIPIYCCYYLNNIALGVGYGSNETQNVTALTAVQMAQQSSFIGFDFTNVWIMGSSYPMLRNVGASVSDNPEAITMSPPMISIDKSSISVGGTATLSWSAVSGASSYIVSWMDTASFETQTATVTSTSYEIKNLSKGSYIFHVMSVDDSIGFCSNPSNVKPLSVVEYLYTTSYSDEVAKGTIRYMCQTTGNGIYFHSSYWGSYKSIASQECQTCCISMALSYLDIDATPQTLFDEIWGSTSTEYDHDDLKLLVNPIAGTSSNTFFDMYNKYESDSDFSPIWVRLKNYGSSSDHYVLIYDKDDGTGVYYALDPSSSSYSGTSGGTIELKLEITKNSSNGYTIVYKSVNYPNEDIPASYFRQYELK